MLIRIIIAGASAIGLYISLYFTLVYFRLVEPDQRFVPAWCRMDNNSCHVIVHSPQAHALGLPNSLYGIFYYLFIASFALINDWYSSYPLQKTMVFFSAAPMLMSIYLFIALRFQLKTHCILCYVSHAINLFLFLLFLLVIG
jgi:uncharacterized membrane protein